MPRPAIGICAAIERVRWGPWDETVVMAPRRTRPQSRKPARCVSAAARRSGQRRAGRAPRSSRRALPRGRLRCRPGAYGAQTASEDARFVAGARRVRGVAHPPGAGARYAGLGQLPGHGAPECRLRRDPRAEPPRPDRLRPPPAHAGCLRRSRGSPGARLAARTGGRRRATGGQVAPSSGHRSGGRGPDRDRLVGARRRDRGDRGSRPALRPRRALASRGGRRGHGDRLACGRGAGGVRA